jgi:AcrR family transcriptional regulator
VSDVKGPRQRSVQTKRRIVAAAQGLIADQGYAGTTLQDIANTAGVAVQTVYFHYGTKSRLLKEVVDVASAGDDQPVPLLDREWFTRLGGMDDAHAVITGWVHASGLILARVAPILSVIRDAAPTDADMAEQWAVNSRQRRLAHSEFVATLTRLRVLRRGLTKPRATDITVALLAPELFLVLTRECGWPLKQWERWTVDHLTHDLLAQHTSAPSRSASPA